MDLGFQCLLGFLERGEFLRELGHLLLRAYQLVAMYETRLLFLVLRILQLANLRLQLSLFFGDLVDLCLKL